MKRFGLSRDERIKSRKDFENIYSVGRSLISVDKKIKLFYLLEKQSEQPGVKIAVAVGKKFGTAVWRNRFKRIIKNSFRLNKASLLNLCLHKKYLLKLVFSPLQINEKNNKKIYQGDVLSGVLEVLRKIENVLG